MLDVGGQDATEAFEDVGHSDEAREILEGLLIGNLKRQVWDLGAQPEAIYANLLRRRVIQNQRSRPPLPQQHLQARPLVLESDYTRLFSSVQVSLLLPISTSRVKTERLHCKQGINTELATQACRLWTLRSTGVRVSQMDGALASLDRSPDLEKVLARNRATRLGFSTLMHTLHAFLHTHFLTDQEDL